MVIDKAKKPRCFKNIDVTNLPVIWQSNKKSWMTEASFIDWIQSLNKIMRSKKRHIILFLDNATSHSHELQLSNVKLIFCQLTVPQNFNHSIWESFMHLEPVTEK